MVSISVVTPSYNQGRFIERTLKSVLDQHYPDLEYLVCDGGSTDETLTILEAYAPRVRVISEPDDGQAAAVNKGIRGTSGDVIGWINSDDVYYPRALGVVSDFFDSHPDIDVVYGEANFIDANDTVTGRYYTLPWQPRRLIQRPFLCQPAVFFRRGVVERFGMLDERLQYTLDYEYWLRLAFGGARFAYVRATLAGSRLHPATKTSSQRLRVHAELNAMLLRYTRRIPDGWILTHTHAILEENRPGTYRSPLEFAIAVAAVSCRLSLDLNGSISPRLAITTLRTIGAGVVKSVLRKPVVAPAR